MSHKNLGPIGSAVLTFIGYKQTNKQTDKPNLYIDLDLVLILPYICDLLIEKFPTVKK